jgi:hypothetical protein
MVSAIVHIGPMKTGTTSLAQYFVRAAKAGVLPEGVLYPHGPLWFNTYRHVIELENLATDENLAVTGWANPQTDDALARVAAATRDSCGESGQAVFISETLFNRRPTSAYITGMLRHFDSVHALVNVRRQDAAVSSMIAHRIRAGTAPAAGDSLDNHILDTPNLLDKFDYGKNLAVWQAENPGVTFSVLPVFESDPDPYRLVRSVYRACGWGDPTPVKDFEGQSFNPSPSPDLIEQLVQKHRASRRWRWLPQVRGSIQKDLLALKREASRPRRVKPRSTTAGGWSLTSRERLFVVNSFAESNKSLLAANRNDSLFAADWNEWQQRLDEATQALVSDSPQ